MFKPTRPLRPKTKQTVFTNNKPLRVLIEFDTKTNKGEIQVHADYAGPINARLHETEGGRELLDTIRTEWSDRRAQNAPPDPHFIGHQGHRPILMREGEVVEFVCDYPFDIWADRDPNVEVCEEAPNNPFGWTEPQHVPGNQTLKATVLTPPLDSTNTPTKPGPTEQRFYKFSAWVYLTDDEIGLVDPDGSCDR